MLGTHPRVWEPALLVGARAFSQFNGGEVVGSWYVAMKANGDCEGLEDLGTWLMTLSREGTGGSAILEDLLGQQCGLGLEVEPGVKRAEWIGTATQAAKW